MCQGVRGTEIACLKSSAVVLDHAPVELPFLFLFFVFEGKFATMGGKNNILVKSPHGRSQEAARLATFFFQI